MASGTADVATIFVVRHGESESNRDGRFAGHVESPLTERGREQARALGDRLAETPITRIVASDLERARETAAFVRGTRSVPVESDARLREMSFGEWEGMVEAEIVERWAEDWEAVLRPKAEFRAPGGESLRELRARMSGGVWGGCRGGVSGRVGADGDAWECDCGVVGVVVADAVCKQLAVSGVELRVDADSPCGGGAGDRGGERYVPFERRARSEGWFAS